MCKGVIVCNDFVIHFAMYLSLYQQFLVMNDKFF